MELKQGDLRLLDTALARKLLTSTEVERSGRRMVRIALTPDWVGTLDFVTRFPAATA